MKIKNWILCFLFLNSFYFLSAQQSKMDSLEQELAKIEIDSIKLNVLSKLTKFYRRNNPDKHLKFTLQGQRIAKTKLRYLELTHFTLEESFYYYIKGDIDSSLIVLEKAEEYAKKSDNTTALLGVLTRAADFNFRKGNLDVASDKYFQALAIGEISGSEDSQVACYMGITQLYETQREYEKALKYIKKCIPLCDSLGGRKTACQSVVFTNLASLYGSLKQYDSTTMYANKSIAIKKELNDIKGLEYSYSVLANANYAQQNYAESKKFYNKALALSREINFSAGIFSNLSKLGLSKLQLDDIDNLESIITELDSLLGHIQSPEDLEGYYELKYQYFDVSGDFSEALKYHKLKAELSDSIRKVENINLIADLETKYQTEKYQQEKSLESAKRELAEKKAQKNLSLLFAVLSLAILIMVLSAFLLYRAKQKKKQELLAMQLAERTKQFDLEKEILVSKLKTLRSQMNPHFIFNLLNSIQYLVLKGDIENSYNFINKFAGLVRSTLDYSDKEKILLSEEIELLNVYLSLEELRFNEDFEYQLLRTGEQKDVKVPPMLIQPFIENALVHGLLHKEGHRKLKVTIELSDVVVCTVEDNGIGREKAKKIRERQRGNHKSFSTSAIEKRFAILSEYYKEELGYTYYDLPESDPMSTKVVLRIPYDKIDV